MKKTLLLTLIMGCVGALAQVKSIKNGPFWLDTDGNVIEAHGVSIMQYNGVYYMIGEDRTNPWVFNGVNMYSSSDLMNWKFENTIIKKNAHPELMNRERIIERPCLLYNKKYNRFVIWLKYQNGAYSNVIKQLYFTQKLLMENILI